MPVAILGRLRYMVMVAPANQAATCAKAGKLLVEGGWQEQSGEGEEQGNLWEGRARGRKQNEGRGGSWRHHHQDPIPIPSPIPFP